MCCSKFCGEIPEINQSEHYIIYFNINTIMQLLITKNDSTPNVLKATFVVSEHVINNICQKAQNS